MRIRYKKWARPELDEAAFFENNPENYKGKWKERFENKNLPICVELGCGKGGFISKLSVNHNDVNYIAIDMIDAMLGLAKRNIEKEYKENNKDINNVVLTRYNIERISNIFSKEDNIERIYINFCNPWPRGKHNKRRLTHPRQLVQYKEFLKDKGSIYFKTDDDNLFNASLEYFESENFKIIKKTFDLENEPDFWENIETEHEKMFKEQGIKIKALIAEKV